MSERIVQEFKRLQMLELEDKDQYIGTTFVYYALCKARFRIRDVAYWMGVADNTLYRWAQGECSPRSKYIIEKLHTYTEAIKFGLSTKRLPSKEETLKTILVKYLNECESVSSEDSSVKRN